MTKVVILQGGDPRFKCRGGVGGIRTFSERAEKLLALAGKVRFAVTKNPDNGRAA